MKTICLVLCAVALGLAAAKCPGSCSGHGRCSIDDKCVCFANKHANPTEYWEFFGPDCSRRTCPRGRSWSAPAVHTKNDVNATLTPGYKNRVSGDFIRWFVVPEEREVLTAITMDVRITKGTEQGFFTWKRAQDSRYGQPYLISDYSGGPHVAMPLLAGGKRTGIHVWFDETKSPGMTFAQNLNKNDKYLLYLPYNYGLEFNAGDANTAHQYEECSGIGSCDFGTGTCKCPAGFSGAACQRRTCPHDCSGHGVCTPLRKFVADLGMPEHSYASAWDAQSTMTCTCDEGYRGPACSLQECPSTKDPMGGFGADGTKLDAANQVVHGPAMDCSGRGTCDYMTGVCSCAKGFFGEACEKQTNFV